MTFSKRPLPAFSPSSPLPFYVTGGTVPGHALSYVERQADTDLYEYLRRGEFCYVLTARQMGKSSLMVRVARRLRDEGTHVALIDLTSVGANLSVEQWYQGMLSRMARQLDREDEAEAGWQRRSHLPPLQRWLAVIEEEMLAALPGSIVVFVDEIDLVRSLPFSTDEFFAGIRACYNRRDLEPLFRRLTFCLLGVARPADLIQDSRTTPFNIGRGIQLHDFTEEEAQPLAVGMNANGREGRLLLARVLHWTGGHPYLTQQLCQAVAQSEHVLTDREVDGLCAHLFFSRERWEENSNLSFVANRLVQHGSEEETAGALDLYRRVRKGRRIPDEETSPTVSLLKLSGIVGTRAGWLQVRNRIYAHVFDAAWIRENLPHAERRRQRRAFWRGVRRTAAISGALLISMGILTLTAFLQWRNAQEAQRQTKRLLYAADMYVQQKEWEAGHYGRSIELLEAQRPHSGNEDLRGWEWRYAWQQAHGERFALRGHTGIVFSVDYSPDGKLLTTAGGDRTVRLWDAQTGKLRATLTGHTANVLAVKFSPNGRFLASCGDDNTLRLWDVHSGRQIGAPMAGCTCVDFSPDGQTVASAINDKNPSVRLWNVATQRQVKILPQSAAVFAIVFSPDSKTLATGGNEVLTGQSKEHIVRLWDVSTFSGAPHFRSLTGHTRTIYGLAFSHDSRLLATGSDDTTARIWNVKSGHLLYTLQKHRGPVSAVAFSPDDRTLATGSWDQTTCFWEVNTGKPVESLRGQPNMVTSVAFARDGKRLATASRQEVRIWDLPTRHKTWQTSMAVPSIGSLALAPDEQTLVVRDDLGSLTWWRYPSGKKLPDLPPPVHEAQGRPLAYLSCAFSPDGNLFAAAQTNEITLWDRRTRQKTLTLRDAPSARGDTFSKLAFSHDSRRLATNLLANNEVCLWDVRTGRKLSHWKAHRDGVLTLAFSPNGNWLVTGSWDRELMVWDLTTTQPTPPLAQTLHGHETPIMAAAFSPDSKTLVTTGEDKTIKFWQVPTFREMVSLPAPDNICTLIFSKDGKTLIVGGAKGSVYTWEVPGWQEIQAKR